MAKMPPEKLAAALRANLARRKQAARKPAPDGAAPAPPKPAPKPPKNGA